MIEIQAVCVECGVKHFAAVTADGYRRYIEGGMAQDCFPNMSADYRELFFISGLCPTCWDILIPEDDEDESDDWNTREAGWEYGNAELTGSHITVTETVKPIVDEIDNLRAQIEELEYQLRVEKAKNV